VRPRPGRKSPRCDAHAAARPCPLGLYLFDRLANDAYPPQDSAYRTCAVRQEGGAGWLGANSYGLGGVEVPVTHPEPFDYQVLGGLMKLW
jgi:hypothetical protein